MIDRYTPEKAARMLAPLFALVVVVGCGGDSAEMAPVHGTVTMNGEPVGNIMVVFRPHAEEGEIEAPTRPSMATVEADGTYELSTYEKGDGAAVGTHTVSVGPATGEGALPGQLPRDHTVEVKPGENTIDLELVPRR